MVTVRHPDRECLRDFARGALSEAEAAAIEEHLSACDDCLGWMLQADGDDPLMGLLRVAGQANAAVEPGLTALRPMPASFPSGYDLLGPIGRGGMGVVFKAYQRGLGRVVALKQIRAGLDANAHERARFQVEAEAAGRLRHPNIVTVHDVGEREGVPYIAMELVEGGSLTDRLARQLLPPRQAAALVETVARAVDYAHQAGIVHRDLKPSNILLTADEEPKVADFGLAKRLDVESGQTNTGALLGTPSYMAPEQAIGEAAGTGADLYALGAILYETLTGRPPFQAATPMETIELVRHADPPPLSRLQPGLARDVQTICLKCLEKDPRRRYPTAAQLADDLARFLRGEPIRARPVGQVERLAKWARRRPAQAALAALCSLALAGAFAGVVAHNARLRVEVERANKATAEASTQRQLADANYREARAAIEKVLGRLDEPVYAGMPRRRDLQRAQVEDALGFFDRVLAVADSTDPGVRLDTARTASLAATYHL
jgi:serine/threonine-protein kinase